MLLKYYHFNGLGSTQCAPGYAKRIQKIQNPTTSPSQIVKVLCHLISITIIFSISLASRQLRVHVVPTIKVLEYDEIAYFVVGNVLNYARDRVVERRIPSAGTRDKDDET